MAEPLVVVTQDGAVRTLTLNRPAALNSFTTGLHAELRAALDAAPPTPSVRCVVLTGAGRGFCAGQDLADPRSRRPRPAAAQGPGRRHRDATTGRWCCACARCRCR